VQGAWPWKLLLLVSELLKPLTLVLLLLLQVVRCRQSKLRKFNEPEKRPLLGLYQLIVHPLCVVLLLVLLQVMRCSQFPSCQYVGSLRSGCC
jgi:hypothetical protein